MTEYTRPATWEDVKTLSEPDVFGDDNRYAVRINDEFTIDVMPAIAGLDWAEMKEHIVSIDVDGLLVRVLDMPGLLKTKQGVRPKDQMDAAMLSAAVAAMRKPPRQ